MDCEFNDEFGPEKIIEVYEPKSGMRGFLVIDNTALGPGKGGIRMTPTLDVNEVFDLARTMTWKNAIAGLPFGGAKSGIIADDKKISRQKKKELITAFAKAVKIVSPSHYLAAPDMNTDAEDIRHYVKANGNRKSATGKPSDIGGIPREEEATGYGVAYAALVAAKHLNKDIKKMTFAVEGFGAVGTNAAKYLSNLGAKFIAVSDSQGCLYDNSGIDYEELVKTKKESGSVVNYAGPGKISACAELIKADADILITAAIPDFIKVGDVDEVKAKIIVEGSNIPIKPEVEELLHNKKILVVPDFVANSGGVISSHAEYLKKDEEQMFKMVKSKISKITKQVLASAKKNKITPREAALEIVKSRVWKKCKTCKVMI
jgi:glutamate dehydrogenase/leucine dehydrogenase